MGAIAKRIAPQPPRVARNIAFGMPNNDIDRQTVERIAQIHGFITDELHQGYDTPLGERGFRL